MTGFDGATGEIDTKNSYTSRTKYNTMLKSNSFLSHIPCICYEQHDTMKQYDKAIDDLSFIYFNDKTS